MTTGGWLFLCLLMYALGWCCGALYEIRAVKRELKREWRDG